MPTKFCQEFYYSLAKSSEYCWLSSLVVSVYWLILEAQVNVLCKNTHYQLLDIEMEYFWHLLIDSIARNSIEIGYLPKCNYMYFNSFIIFTQNFTHSYFWRQINQCNKTYTDAYWMWKMKLRSVDSMNSAFSFMIFSFHLPSLSATGIQPNFQ